MDPRAGMGVLEKRKISCPYPVCSLVAVPTTLSTQIVHILCDVAQFGRHLEHVLVHMRTTWGMYICVLLSSKYKLLQLVMR